jgi:hypothetical protein
LLARGAGRHGLTTLQHPSASQTRLKARV